MVPSQNVIWTVVAALNCRTSWRPYQSSFDASHEMQFSCILAPVQLFLSLLGRSVLTKWTCKLCRPHFHNFESSTLCRHLLWRRNKTPMMNCFKLLDNIQMILAQCIKSEKIVSWHDCLTQARKLAWRNRWSRKWLKSNTGGTKKE